MEIEAHVVDPYDRYCRINTITKSIEDFVADHIFCENQFATFAKSKRLEDQPYEVCKAFGKLINLLMEKNVINLNDLIESDIISVGHGCKEIKIKE